jgi:DNA topoisomerase IA
VAGKFEKHDEHFENDQYVVTSAVGHLLEIQAPEAFDVKRGKWSFRASAGHPPVFRPEAGGQDQNAAERRGPAGQAQRRGRAGQRLRRGGARAS